MINLSSIYFLQGLAFTAVIVHSLFGLHILHILSSGILNKYCSCMVKRLRGSVRIKMKGWNLKISWYHLIGLIILIINFRPSIIISDVWSYWSSISTIFWEAITFTRFGKIYQIGLLFTICNHHLNSKTLKLEILIWRSVRALESLTRLHVWCWN